MDFYSKKHTSQTEFDSENCFTFVLSPVLSQMETPEIVESDGFSSIISADREQDFNPVSDEGFQMPILADNQVYSYVLRFDYDDGEVLYLHAGIYDPESAKALERETTSAPIDYVSVEEVVNRHQQMMAFMSEDNPGTLKVGFIPVTELLTNFANNLN